MENDSDSSYAPSFSPSTSVSSTDHTDTRLLNISAEDGSVSTLSSAVVAAAASTAQISSTSPSFDSTRKMLRAYNSFCVSSHPFTTHFTLLC